MAQHDYVIDNQSFPATRTDLNNVLQAIVSNNSGTSAPSTTFANQIWYDSNANILYIRNEDNDANIPLMQFDQSADVAATLATVIDILDASGTDQAGTALTIRGGAGTGTGAGGSIIFQTADGAGSTGSSVNAHATRVTITDDGKVGIGDTTPETPIEINTANTLGSTFTGTTAGEGLRVTQSSYSAGNYVSLVEAPHQQGGVPNVRIAGMFDGGGSNLAFGTSNSYGSGITNTAMFIDSSGLVGIGTATPAHELTIQTSSADPTLRIHADTDSSPVPSLEFMRGTNDTFGADAYTDFKLSLDAGDFKFEQAANGTTTEVMQLDSSGRFLFGKSTSNGSTAGVEMQPVTSTNSSVWIVKNTTGSSCLFMNRTSSAGDGHMILFSQNDSIEGTISVSGTTVSYNGGHLSRWSQLTDGKKDTSIVKGTVMTNLDEMAVWAHDAVEAQDAVLDDDGNVVTEAVEAKDAYTEDNEQLNCMAVSSVEGDPNVAGVFVNWDNDDDGFNDMNVAMTGDMVIRIAQGTTVARGDLLMSAGDGTAKPQDDDIVRSKTIAKVTSTQVSHTYDDGTYLVPCVLMAC